MNEEPEKLKFALDFNFTDQGIFIRRPAELNNRAWSAIGNEIAAAIDDHMRRRFGARGEREALN